MNESGSIKLTFTPHDVNEINVGGTKFYCQYDDDDNYYAEVPSLYCGEIAEINGQFNLGKIYSGVLVYLYDDLNNLIDQTEINAMELEVQIPYYFHLHLTLPNPSDEVYAYHFEYVIPN